MSYSSEHAIIDMSYIERDLSYLDTYNSLENFHNDSMRILIDGLNLTESQESYFECSTESENIDKIIGFFKAMFKRIADLFISIANYLKKVFTGNMAKVKARYDKFLSEYKSTESLDQSTENLDVYIMNTFVDDKVHCLKGLTTSFFNKANITISKIMEKGMKIYKFDKPSEFNNHEYIVPIMRDLIEFDPKTKDYLQKKLKENEKNGIDIYGFFSSIEPEQFCNTIMPIRKSVRMKEIIDGDNHLKAILDYASGNNALDKLLKLCTEHGNKNKQLAEALSKTDVHIENKKEKIELLKMSVQASRGFSKVLTCFKNIYFDLNTTLRILVDYIVRNKVKN